MKQLILFSFLLFATVLAEAQNVGIGTSSPTEKLEIHNPVNSVVKISSANYNDTSRLILSNRDNTNAGTDFLLSAIQEQGLLISTRSDLANNNNDSLLVLKSSGRLGLGVKNPVTKLDVNGGARLAGFNTLEFGGGVAGKETNAGKIGYGSFSGDALDIVGAGTSTTNRKVYLFAEGGTYVQGPLNITSSLQINSNAGAAGQVLTSTGTGTPQWRTLANDNIRFGVNFYGVTSPLPVSDIYYNLSPADVVINGGASSITFNQSGLYHFEGTYAGLVQGTGFSGAPEYSTFMSFSGSTTYGLNLCVWKQLTLRTVVNNNWYHDDKFSIDLQVTAPAQLQFGRLFLTGAVTPSYVDARVTVFGYRISQ